MHTLTRKGFQGVSVWSCPSLGGEGSPWVGPAPMARLLTSVSGLVLREEGNRDSYSFWGKPMARMLLLWLEFQEKMSRVSTDLGNMDTGLKPTCHTSPRRDPGGPHHQGMVLETHGLLSDGGQVRLC